MERDAYQRVGGHVGAVLYVLPPLSALVGWLAGWPGLATAGLMQTLLAIAGRALHVVQLGQAP